MSWDEIHDHCSVFGDSSARRRSWLQIAALDAAIYQICEEYPVITVRQLYYQLVSRGIVPKTEQAYKNIAVRRSGILRTEGFLDYDKFADATRWMRKPTTDENVDSALGRFANSFRRDLWADSDHYVEIWCEKDALAGVITDITSKYDVPLMVSRGYSSLSFLHSAAMTISRKILVEKKRVSLYHFGDWDPSGQDAARVIEQTISDMVFFDLDMFGFRFEKVAVTPDQIEELNLPERPTKQSDPRTKNWTGGSVELDAIDPKKLCEIVEGCITQHIDDEALEKTRKMEAAEQETLREFSYNFGKKVRKKAKKKVKQQEKVA